MHTVRRVITDLAEYSAADLEVLEDQHPEWGRLEVLDGALHATGGSAVGDLHQLVVQRLLLMLIGVCPASDVVRVDAWWRSARGLLRPDVAIYRAQDRPVDGRAFTAAPRAVVEVLGDDVQHDLVHKDEIYAEAGAACRAYVDPWGRQRWWCRLDGLDHTDAVATWRLPAWPSVDLERDELLAD